MRLCSAGAKAGVGELCECGTAVVYEVFGDGGAGSPVVIVLPGSSGPDAPLYRSQAQYFADHGYTTLLLHYFDAARSKDPSEENYQRWVAALGGLVKLCSESPDYRGRRVLVVGYSLGASIALAAGSQLLPVAGIADWYGSLPDAFFFKLKGMPPLLILHGGRDQNIPVRNSEQLIRLCQLEHFRCESHIYADQGHGFADEALRDADQRTLAFFRSVSGLTR